ncbi:hypothetical protein V7128_02125 [Neobacillus vireti]|uniref:hypothetical protein n=1 Tax=Neobacillus vireti TaxID=220686 RepID=UPI002FFDB937
MLKKFNVTNYNEISFIQSEDQPTVLIIAQADEYDYSYKYEIGRYDFSTKEGYLQLLNGTRKEYKRFNALLNNFFKYNEYFGWNSTIVSNCKEAAQQTTVSEVIEEDTTEVIEVSEVIETIEINQTTEVNEVVYIVGNRTFTTYTEAESYCNESDFDPELMIIEVATSEPLESTTIEQEPTEVYYVYNTTHNSYSEAYNYCIINDYPVTMILSSNYPTMNNERLQQLELEYKFSKHNMNITDMKEYYDYIMVQHNSTDQLERYSKLRSWIERYENKQIRIKENKEHEKEMAIQINNMLSDLYSIGMVKKDYENTSVTFYYLDNELIYNWSSGIPTEKMYNELTEVHKRYYNESKAV